MAFKGFVFLDTETTGLEPDREEVLEIGVVLTDHNLNEFDSRYWITKTMSSQVGLERLYLENSSSEFVRDMHTKSGLTDEFRAAKQFNRLIYINEIATWLYDREADKMPMCGSSIGFDRGFLQHHYPEINDIFHYRNIDVSTFKEFFKTTRPDVYAQVEKRVEKITGNTEAVHRTIADCRGSIEQLRAYSEFIAMDRDLEPF